MHKGNAKLACTVSINHRGAFLATQGEVYLALL